MPAKPTSLSKIILCAALLSAGLLSSACQEEVERARVPADQSKLKQATDVFWALQNIGFIAAKEKPSPSSHGCKPTEYLARKGESTFRISVFECPTAEKAREVVEHPKSRHVDSLLRNHHEGGILRRQAMEVIIRLTKGKAEDADALLDAIGGM